MSDETTRAVMNGKPVFTVPVKTVLNLHSGFEEKLLCDGPTFSLGDACAYSCSFCYVEAILKKLDRVRLLLAQHGLKHEDVVIRREEPLVTLLKQLCHSNGKPRFPDPADRRVVYSSPLVDVAANVTLVRETVAACRLILQHTHWQIRLLSKSTLLYLIANELADDHGAKSRVIYGVSTGTPNDRLASAFEQGTPLVSRRIQSLHKLQDWGCRTFGMICPSLPISSGDYGPFAREMAEALRVDKCEHVWAEVINVRGESMVRTVAALKDAGYEPKALELEYVSTHPEAWEQYNRATFEAHAEVYASSPGKLRYLVYPTPSTRDFWQHQISRGAVLLGAHAHGPTVVT